MNRRRVAWLLGVPLALGLLLAATGWFALGHPRGLELALERLAGSLPGELTVREVDGPLGGPWRIAGLRYAEVDGLVVVIDRLDVDWSPWSLLGGELQLQRVAAGGVTLSLAEGAATAGPPTLPAWPELPVAVGIAALDIDGLRIDRPGAETLVAERVGLAGRVDGRGVRLDRLELEASWLQVELLGNVDPGQGYRHEVSGRWRLELPDRPAVAGPLTLAGDATRLTLRQRLVEPVAADIELTVDEPFADLRWSGRVTLDDADPSRLDAGLPAWPASLGIEASGTLEAFVATVEAAVHHPEYGLLDATTRLEGDRTHFAVAETIVRLGDSGGRLRIDAADADLGGPLPVYRARGGWEGVRWPLAGAPSVASNSGRYDVGGTLHDYAVNLSGDLQLPDLPGLGIAATGRGDLFGIDIDEIAVEVADQGGRAAGSGRLDWSERLRWEVAAIADGLDPGRFVAGWPGRLGGPFRVTGGLEEAGVAAEVTLDGLAGTLRDLPVTASGRFVLAADGALALDAMELRSAGGTARLDGTVSEPLALRWGIDSDDLAGLLPGVAGALRADGELAGRYAAPRFAARGEARGIDGGERGRAARLDFTLSADLADPEGRLSIDVDAAGVVAGGQAIDSLRLQALGTTAAHDAELQVSAAAGVVTVGAGGGYTVAGWRGSLRSAMLQPAGGERWSLREPAQLDAASGAIDLARACWRHEQVDSATACVAGSWRADSGWRARVEGRAVPLAALERWLPDGPRMTGTADVDARVEQAGPVGIAADGTLVLSPGTLMSATDGARPLRHGGGGGEFSVGPAGLTSSLRLDLGEGGGLRARMALPAGRLAWPLPDATPLDGDLHLELTRLETLDGVLPALSIGGGTLRGSLHLAGTAAVPSVAGRVEFDVAALGLPGSGMAVRELRGSLSADLDVADAALAVDVVAVGGVVDGQPFDELRLRVHGTTAVHELDLHAGSGTGVVEAAAAGGYAKGAWRGELRTAVMEDGEWGRWLLQRPASVALAAGGGELGKACWRRDGSDPGEACVDGRWRRDGGWRSQIEAHALPLATLNRWLPGGTQLTGTVDLDALLEQDGAAGPVGRGMLTLSAGALIPGVALAGAQPLYHAGGSGEFMLGAEGLTSSLHLDLGDVGEARARLALPGERLAWPLPATTPVDGELQFAFSSLEPFDRLLPALAVGDGTLRGELRLAGTFGDPRSTGRVELDIAELELPVAGITLRDLRSVVEADGSAVLQVSGGARSGQGRIDYLGDLQLDPAAGWPLTLRVSGERFEAVDLHELWLLVDPDVTLRLAGRDLALEGTLHIPEADIRPRAGVRGLQRTSRDAVVVDRANGGVREEALRQTARITVELGERVRFEGFGLSGQIAGRVAIEDLPDALPRGNGELRVMQGRYSGYGSPLEIERGRLLFANSAVDNPGLDARAVRRIDDVTAGARVRGTLRDPEVTLFSEPGMPQADILSYLVVGRPLKGSEGGQSGEQVAAAAAALGFVADSPMMRDLRRGLGIDELGVESDSTSDQVSLVLGRYLSPDIYVGYAVGLTEPTSLFRVRYQFSRRWSVEAESGTHSGADLNFSIER